MSFLAVPEYLTRLPRGYFYIKNPLEKWDFN
jgi:hypothetical protein